MFWHDGVGLSPTLLVSLVANSAVRPTMMIALDYCIYLHLHANELVYWHQTTATPHFTTMQHAADGGSGIYNLSRF